MFFKLCAVGGDRQVPDPRQGTDAGSEVWQVASQQGFTPGEPDPGCAHPGKHPKHALNLVKRQPVCRLLKTLE